MRTVEPDHKLYVDHIRKDIREAWKVVESSRGKGTQAEIDALEQAEYFYNRAHEVAVDKSLNGHFRSLPLYGLAYAVRQLSPDRVRHRNLADQVITEAAGSGTEYCPALGWQEHALGLRYTPNFTEQDIRTALNLADISIGKMEHAVESGMEFESQENLLRQLGRAHSVKAPLFVELANFVAEPEKEAYLREGLRTANLGYEILTDSDLLFGSDKVEPLHTLVVQKTGLTYHERSLPPGERRLLQSALGNLEEARQFTDRLPQGKLYDALFWLREADLRMNGEPENRQRIAELMELLEQNQDSISPRVYDAVAGNIRRIATFLGPEYESRMSELLQNRMSK